MANVGSVDVTASSSSKDMRVPATQALIKLAVAPANRALQTMSAKSGRREGAIAPSPPN